MTSPWDEWEALIRKDDVDPLEVLRAAARYQRYFAAIEREAIRSARGMGRTWEEIANAVGRSRQAVWERFRTDKPTKRTWVDLGPAKQWLAARGGGDMQHPLAAKPKRPPKAP